MLLWLSLLPRWSLPQPTPSPVGVKMAPVFFGSRVFDVVVLVSSLASVVMFLSILTSPFELWDFYKSLPRKLSLGSMLLFVSLVCTMLAFSATILLAIRLGCVWNGLK